MEPSSMSHRLFLYLVLVPDFQGPSLHPGKSWESSGLAISKTSIQCTYSSGDTCVLQMPGPGAWISSCSSMTSYLLRAWEGVERATRSPWVQGTHNVAAAKAILVHFVLIFPRRRQMSHIWDGSEDGLSKQRPRYKSQLHL